MSMFFGKKHDTTDKKMSDLVFKTKMTVAILSILACITIMISTAFALFSSTTGYSSTLNSATWRVLVESTEMGVVHGDYFCAQAEDDKHSFRINASGTPGASGYCIITITSPDGEISKYNTDVFNDEFYLLIQAQEGCRISFNPHWGDPRNFGDTNFTHGIILHSVTPVEIEEEEELLSPEEPEPGTEGGDALDQLLGILGGGNADSSTSTDNVDGEDSSGSSDESTGILDHIFDVFGGGDTSPAPSDDTGSGDTSPAPSDDTSGGDTSPAPSDDTSGGDTSPAPSDDTSGGDTSPAPSDDTSGGDTSPAPSDDTSGGDTSPAPSDDTSGGDTSPAPSDSTGGGVDIAPPPSSSGNDSGTSSSSDGSGGADAPSAPSGSSGGDSSPAPSGDGE